jgi:hypothetical protein
MWNEMNNIVLFLRSMGEHGMAEEVEAEHNRLEAFAGGLDKDCLGAQFKAGAASRDDEIKALRKALLHMCGNTIAKDTYRGNIVSEALGYRHHDHS